MNVFRYTVVSLLLLFSVAESLYAQYTIHAYRDYSDPQMQKMTLLGQITSRGHSLGGRKRVLDYDTREMTITARLYDDTDIRRGDTIYIIDKNPDHRRYHNGLIIAQGEVFSIFETGFQGKMLKAKGSFSMVKKGFFIARPDRTEERSGAWVYYRKGDRYMSTGQIDEAFRYYRKSLQLDPDRPETLMKLAALYHRTGRSIEEGTYLKQAWDKLSRFTDANDVLELSGRYLRYRLSEIDNSAETESERLAQLLDLLQQTRQYKKRLRWFQKSFSDETMQLLRKKGVPVQQYQFRIGQLYNNIRRLIENRNLRTVLGWLDPGRRQVLYKMIELPYRRDKRVDPQKMWDEAFFQAALYHFQLAHELDSLDTSAAYEIVKMCADKLKIKPSRIQRETYAEIGRFYADEYLKVPDQASRMSAVRNLRKTFSKAL